MIRGRRRRTTTSAQISTAPPPDLVDRCFDARGPNRLWVANLTYVRTWSGWAYVAFVLDVYSRMIVAGSSPRTCAPSSCWTRWSRRCGHTASALGPGSSITCDRGSQYLSLRYSERLEQAGSRRERSAPIPAAARTPNSGRPTTAAQACSWHAPAANATPSDAAPAPPTDTNAPADNSPTTGRSAGSTPKRAATAAGRTTWPGVPAARRCARCIAPEPDKSPLPQ